MQLWVRAEVIVKGSESIEHIIIGETGMKYEHPQIGGGNISNFDPAVKADGKLLEQGTICLQSESHPVQFQKVELLNLMGCMDVKAKNYRKRFVKNDTKSCRY